jgi:hypothetical protein
MDAKVSIEAQISCVIRELALRRSAYPKWIESRRLTVATAERETAGMEAVLATLREVAEDRARIGSEK